MDARSIVDPRANAERKRCWMPLRSHIRRPRESDRNVEEIAHCSKYKSYSALLSFDRNDVCHILRVWIGVIFSGIWPRHSAAACLLKSCSLINRLRRQNAPTSFLFFQTCSARIRWAATGIRMRAHRISTGLRQRARALMRQCRTPPSAVRTAHRLCQDNMRIITAW